MSIVNPGEQIPEVRNISNGNQPWQNSMTVPQPVRSARILES